MAREWDGEVPPPLKGHARTRDPTALSQGPEGREAQGEGGKKASVKGAQDKERKAIIGGKAAAWRREVSGGGRCRKQAGV